MRHVRSAVCQIVLAFALTYVSSTVAASEAPLSTAEPESVGMQPIGSVELAPPCSAISKQILLQAR